MHLVINYLMLTNYFWMFCEGLHLLLVLVVVSSSTFVILLLGFGPAFGF